MTAPFPRPAQMMMAARKKAFEAPAPRNYDRDLFAAQVYRLRASDVAGPGLIALADQAVDHLATYPDGDGIGYFLIEGASQGRTVEQVRHLSWELFNAVWKRFRSRSRRFAPDREFYCAQTLTEDGSIPVNLFGSRWSFKPPHADRNGVLFAHVYGPTVGYEGGDVFVLDALAYALEAGLKFREAITWSDEPSEQKPVLRPEHVSTAVDLYGRRFGRMNHDQILLINNSPEGLFHGATEVAVIEPTTYSRVLHRCVVRERS